MAKQIPIVPIVVGTQIPSVCKGIAEALRPWFTPDNLFIISADFSHYPSYENAQKVDAATAEAFCTNSISGFLKTLENNEKLRIPDLATSMCAWPSGLILLNLTEGNSSLKFSRIDYKNSGDIKPYGDKASVVGYHAICISEKVSGQFDLSDTDKTELLKIARNTIESYVRNRTIPPVNPAGFSQSLKTPAGAFVTLKADGQLRGCIGSFEPASPLYKVVQEMAIASATQDSRFLPVQTKELKDIHIEISVLTPMIKIRDISEIKLGTHGIYIKKGFQGGTFLPQVATETGWTLDEFLGHCARDKAGIGWSGWKDADIFTYEAIIFEEDLLKQL
jgi:AmmeMemoRadiSam system protein A